VHEHETVVVVALVTLHRDQNKSMDTPEEHIDQEQDEVLLIVVAHAIVHPWTVMVHASHTTLTR
jgi:hypothetical protein